MSEEGLEEVFKEMEEEVLTERAKKVEQKRAKIVARKLAEEAEKRKVEEEAEEVWYPEFGLKSDPFGFYDFGTEIEYNIRYPLVKTLANKRIASYGRARTNIILVGIKGSGKSVAMHLAGKELEELGMRVIAFVAPREIKDIYNILWDVIVGIGDGIYYEKVLDWFGGSYLGFNLSWFEGKRCKYWDCLKKDKCIWRGRKVASSAEKMVEEIFYIRDRSCPLKRHITHQILDWLKFDMKGYVFLVDTPDRFIDTGRIGRKYFGELIIELQKLGTIIITATTDQYLSMLKSESLARYQHVDFPLPNKKELEEIYVERIKAFQEGDYPLPFTDEALNYLIEVSRRIPREFISKCSQVLSSMQDKGVKAPADLKFVLNTLGFGTEITETDAITMILAELRVKGRIWVKVKEIKVLLEKKYGILMTLSRLGRKLSKRGLTHRYASDSQYKVRAG